METIMGDMAAIMAAMVGMVWIINIVTYIFVAFCLHMIARKTKTEHGWLAWIPIANVYLMCKIAERPWWWVLVLIFVPIVNIVFLVIVWMGIAEARDKNKWLGILIIVPIANYVLFGYLAFSGGDRRTVKEEHADRIAPRYLVYAGQGTVTTEVGPQPRRGTKETQQAIADVGSEVYGKNVRLVVPRSVGFQGVAEFKQYLQSVKNLTVVMTGGSVDEGSIIVVSGQESMDLVHTLNQMPMVEIAQVKGENIMVNLRPSQN